MLQTILYFQSTAFVSSKSTSEKFRHCERQYWNFGLVYCTNDPRCNIKDDEWQKTPGRIEIASFQCVEKLSFFESSGLSGKRFRSSSYRRSVVVRFEFVLNDELLRILVSAVVYHRY